MTEAEWHTSQDPDILLDAARAMKRLSARKGRLYGCGCYRLVWDRVTVAGVRTAVEMSEARADLRISEQELEAHRYPMTNPSDVLGTWLTMAVQSLAIPKPNPSYVAWSVRSSTDNDIYRHARRGLPCPSQAELVREVIGNPFRPAAFDPKWRTADVVGVARGIYDDRAFDRLPLLADALMDAGCDGAEILAHCRSAGPHVRGCWVVDLVLGKD